MKYHLSNENELAGGTQRPLFTLYAWLTTNLLPIISGNNTSQKGKYTRWKSKADKIFNEEGLNRNYILRFYLQNTLQIF